MKQSLIIPTTDAVPVRRDDSPMHEAYDVEIGYSYHQLAVVCSPDSQRAFIRKVYAVLTAQLLVTAGFSAFCMKYGPVRNYLIQFMWPFYTCLFSSLFVIILLFLFRKKKPLNALLLGLWTLAQATMVGIVTASYASAGAGDCVVQAASYTFVVFAAITLFTFQSKIDFSFLGAGLFACTMIFLVWGIVISIIGYQSIYLYSLFGAILFCGWLIYDTYNVINRLDLEDEWILGVISLYLDVLNIFLYILQLVSSQRR
jgi:FtsH-binding integral membrane protein